MSVHWVKADLAVASVEILFDRRVRPLKPGGGGWLNLCRLKAPDRWASLIRKKLELNTKSHFAMIGRKEPYQSTRISPTIGRFIGVSHVL